MNDLPLQPLVWDSQNYTKSALHQYLVRKDDEATKNSKSQYVVAYGRINTQQSFDVATGFATIDDAKQWAWNHYNEKMQPYVKPDSITDIRNWFKAAKPEPTFNDYITQLGCHIEEMAEMALAIGAEDSPFYDESSTQAEYLKGLVIPSEYIETQKNLIDNTELLDALCDQIVTATGVAYMMGFDIEGALKEVIRSNNSKMVNGKFEFDDNGKIAKPDSYSKPDLTPFVKESDCE